MKIGIETLISKVGKRITNKTDIGIISGLGIYWKRIRYLKRLWIIEHDERST